MRLARSYSLLLSLPLVASAGCRDTPVEARPELNRLKALGILYGKYSGAHGGRMPENENELLQYIRTSEGSILKQFGVDDPAKLLTSPRDGKPLVVAYGKGISTEANPMVAYESEAVNGTRLAVWSTGLVQELTEERFQALRPSK